MRGILIAPSFRARNTRTQTWVGRPINDPMKTAATQALSWPLDFAILKGRPDVGVLACSRGVSVGYEEVGRVLDAPLDIFNVGNWVSQVIASWHEGNRIR